MKTNLKAYQLIEKGFSSKTISSLTESQIDVLFSRLIGEQVKQEKKQITKTTIPASTARTTGANVDGVSIKMDAAGNVVASQTTEGEMLEQPDTEVSTLDKSKGGTTQQPTQVMAPDGMDDDSDSAVDKEKDITEANKSKKNPYAICTAQLGKEFGTTKRSEWTKSQEKKYESCKASVEKSLKEGKNPLSLFLENEIMKIVERNLPPRITKGDLMKFLSEAGPATAPTKPSPGTKPTTKPGKPDPRPRPKHPGKNPNPGENPAPKAKKVSAEKAKDEVIDLIINLLDK
jgi:hypothetical protein